jgi:hypothetical protein
MRSTQLAPEDFGVAGQRGEADVASSFGAFGRLRSGGRCPGGFGELAHSHPECFADRA